MSGGYGNKYRQETNYYCEICNCWLANNPASIDFHATGKKHKENVATKLRESRQRSADAKAAKSALNSQLKDIEEAARKAMFKDLASNPALANDSSFRRAYSRGASIGGTSLAAADDTGPSADDRNRAMSKALQGASAAREKAAEQQQKLQNVYVDPNGWCTAVTSDGHEYFYNTITRQSSWEIPAGFVPPLPTEKEPSADEAVAADASPVDNGENHPAGTDAAETAAAADTVGSHKEPEPEPEPELEPEPVKEKTTGVGMWQTVAAPEPKPEQPVIKEESEASAPGASGGGGGKRKAKSERPTGVGEAEERYSFGERTMPTLRKAGPSGGVALAIKKKRPRGNVRKSTTKL